MTWFTARVVFRCDVEGDSDAGPLFEECVYLIAAENEDAALERAATLGRAAAHTYLNDEMKPVEWRLVRVADVFEIVDAVLTDGTEIYSRLSYDEPT